MIPTSPVTALVDHAAGLVKSLADTISHGHDIGTMSVAIYDTAWLAMLRKKDNEGGEYWVFPESYRYIIEQQEDNGGWSTNRAQVDTILNTMAAVLAMSKHKNHPDTTGCPRNELLPQRIDKAVIFLQQYLQAWDIDNTVHVGFEILVPKLLSLLHLEGISFDFPGQKLLQEHHDRKMSRFKPKSLYHLPESTMFHSLEAFIGDIDFDQIASKTVNGSFMASPAATAAYLIHTSHWDDEAESYLRTAIKLGEGQDSGAVPCAFPTTIFEVAWVMSTLLEAGFTKDLLGSMNSGVLVKYMKDQLAIGNGVVGFAPGFEADADDTAKSILSLNLYGDSFDVSAMLQRFRGSTSFKTYVQETNGSLSVNCNVLDALITSVQPEKHMDEIILITNHLSDAWERQQFVDKWNLSLFYSVKLLSQAFTRLLRLYDQDLLIALPESTIRKVTRVLLAVTIRLLRDQDASGSWIENGNSLEATAYSILALKHVCNLPWLVTIQTDIVHAIERGRDQLLRRKSNWSEGDYIWVEKVSYRSSVLSLVYCVSAIYFQPLIDWSNKVSSILGIDEPRVNQFSKFFSALPMFRDTPAWLTKVSLVESYLYASLLQNEHSVVFSRKGLTKDKYLEYIPFTWLGCNNLLGTPLGRQELETMMLISMLNYQIDEFMETEVEEQHRNDISQVRSLVERICQEAFERFQLVKFDNLNGTATASAGGTFANGHKHNDLKHNENDYHTSKRVKLLQTNGQHHDDGHLLGVKATLRAFLRYVLQFLPLDKASTMVREGLQTEITKFLLAHITHAQDNIMLQRQMDNIPTQASDKPLECCFIKGHQLSYYDWVHTTSADHTSAPYSWLFFTTLISQAENLECFQTASSRYLAQDVCRHLAIMCRQFNDLGSITRDFAEKNLNSINFREFESQDRDVQAHSKTELLFIAEYEREQMLLAKSRLALKVDEKIMNKLDVFCQVTDLYGQIYVARDIASRVKGMKKSA